MSSGTSVESAPCRLKNVRSPVDSTVITSVNEVGRSSVRITAEQSTPFDARNFTANSPLSSVPTLPTAFTATEGSSVFRSIAVLLTEPPTARFTDEIGTSIPLSGQRGIILIWSVMMLPQNAMEFFMASILQQVLRSDTGQGASIRANRSSGRPSARRDVRGTSRT